MKQFLKCIGLLFFVISCSKKSNPSKSNVNQVEKIVGIQKSVINLPIKISNETLANKIAGYIPQLIYKDDNIDDDNYTFTVSRLGNPEISSANEGFMLSLALKIEAKAKVDIAGFSGTYPVYCEIKPKFLIIPSVSGNWKVKTKTISQGFQWLVTPSVKVGFFTVDVSTMAESVLRAQQTRIADEIDSFLNTKLDLKPQATQLWANAQEPIFLSQETNAWFRFVPDSIALMPIFCENGFVKSGFRLKGSSEVVSGEKPERTNIALPKAGILAAIATDFSIFTSIQITHDVVTEAAKKQLLQKKFDFEGNKNITFTDLKFGSKNQKMRTESEVSGTYNGKIILDGVPYYDSSSQQILVEKLDFEFDTKNKLHKTAAWLAEGKILKNLNPYIKFPMKEQLNQMETNIKQFLSNNKISPNVVLNGKMLSLQPKKQIRVSEKHYTLFLTLQGTTETELLKLE